MTCAHQICGQQTNRALLLTLKGAHWGISRFVEKKFPVDIGCFVVAARMILGASAVDYGFYYIHSVRIEDGESHLASTAVCDFIHNFFICEECRQHFYAMCSSVSSPFKKNRAFALWLWSAHNKVNERLMKEEASLGTGDPKFPKIIWPPKSLCPSCYINQRPKNNGSGQIDWDHDEAFKFLANYYEKMLVSLYKDTGLFGDGETGIALAEDLAASTNAVVVPVGAVAVASCAFGALAYFWRSQQKNRKYLHLHSLKSI